MNCKNCGFKYDDDVSFCRRCGSPIESTVVTVARVPVKTVDKESNKKSVCIEVIRFLLKIVYITLTALSLLMLLASLLIDPGQLVDRAIQVFVLFFMFFPNALLLLMLYRKSLPFLRQFNKRHFFASAIVSMCIGFLLVLAMVLASINADTSGGIQVTSSHSMQAVQSEIGRAHV